MSKEGNTPFKEHQNGDSILSPDTFISPVAQEETNRTYINLPNCPLVISEENKGSGVQAKSVISSECAQIQNEEPHASELHAPQQMASLITPDEDSKSHFSGFLMGGSLLSLFVAGNIIKCFMFKK